MTETTDMYEQLRSLAARQAMTEVLLSAAIAHMAELSGAPNQVLGPIMTAAEKTLHAKHEESHGKEKGVFGLAIQYFNLLDEALVTKMATGAPVVGNA